MARADHNTQVFRRVVAALLFVALGVAGVAATSGGPPWVVVVVFGCLAFVAENVGLRLPASISLSPLGIVTMAGVAALNGHGAVLGGTLIGACGGVVIELVRGRRWDVFAYNIAQYALQTAAAASVFDALTASHLPLVVTVPFAAITNLAVNITLLAPSVALRKGVRVAAVLGEMGPGVVSELFFGLVGLLLGVLWVRVGPLSLVVALGVGLVARTVFAAVARFRLAYGRLQLLYDFTQHVSQSRDESETARVVLAELARSLEARRAELVTVAPEGGWRRISLLSEHDRPLVEHGEGIALELRSLGKGASRLTELDDPEARAVAVHRLGDEGIIAPIRTDGALMGSIALGAPIGRGWSADDLRLLETLTNHAAVSLSNGRLLDRLRWDGTHDALTSLPNRARFNELVAELPSPSAVMLIDLDRFKEVNDTLGHQHGDLLIKNVAERITAEVGARGLVARLGGDEFGVLLPSTGRSNAAQVAVSLLSALERPFLLNDLQLEITASIGVAVATPDLPPVRLLQQADVAMYSAKAAHSGWELYSPSRDHHTPRRLVIAGELRNAISSGQLEVHYQPKAVVADGRTCGVEALVRWRHPEHGIIGPDEFVPVAEGAGLIRPLTNHVLEEAVAQRRTLRAMGFDLDVAVNLSVRSILDVNLPDHIREILRRWEVPAGALTIEITESSVMSDPERTIGILGRLSALGVRISVDDFGTGYSSLSYLKRLPATEVKIDRTFVAGLLDSPSDDAIVRSTVELAHNLGLRAVAEGVEETATWDRLAAIGCDFAQGYLISRPMPAEELHAWLQAGRPVA